MFHFATWVWYISSCDYVCEITAQKAIAEDITLWYRLLKSNYLFKRYRFLLFNYYMGMGMRLMDACVCALRGGGGGGGGGGVVSETHRNGSVCVIISTGT